MKNNYTVVNASAGSGKTYFLVQQVLMICLRYPNAETKIGHILALTFTNKAANEMKSRILSWLKDFAVKDVHQNNDLQSMQQKFANEGIHITLDELKERAKKLLDYILHHYSVLNISTIDKFNTRLVKSFSNELGLAHNFNLEIHAEPYLKEAIDQLLDRIGEDESYSSLFIDFMNYHLDNNSKINLNNQLFESSKAFLQDKHYESLKKNSDFDMSQYRNKTLQLRNEIDIHKKTIQEIAQTSLRKIEDQGLAISDFSGGKKNGIGLFFQKILNNKDSIPFPTNTETIAQEVFAKGASASCKKKAEVCAIVDDLIEQRNVVFSEYIAMRKKEKILKSLLPLKVNKDIQDELQQLEEENDLVFLSQFNSLIKENLQNEPSAFIYEKIGTKFQYFFFDEFQDTSQMQWQNFVPIRDNVVSENDTGFTLVGDPKQSIYRFRGGDSDLMMQIINHTEKSPVPANVIILDSNWRSAQNIVDFNNKLYQFHAQSLKVEHQNIFGNDAQQIPQIKEIDGRVKVSLLENSVKSIWYEEVSNAMHRDIQECLDNGFGLSDITLLCRGNKEIAKFSQLLGAKKINYQGKEVFIKTISESGLTLNISQTLKALMAFLNWKLNTQNRRYLAESLYWLNQLQRIKIEDFSAEIFELFALKSDQQMMAFIHNRYGVQFSSHHLPQLNLYNWIEFYLKEFSVANKEEDFILNFLEILHAFTQSPGLTLKDFVQFWDDEGREISILASENIDAVQLMTIHKAKGLEFPVVFYPLANESKESSFTEWLNLADDDVLPNVYVSQFEDRLMEYDQEIKEFNESHRYENIIDALCLQYVATTRPVEQLFLYLEKEKNNNKLGILDFIYTFNNGGKDVFDLYSGDFCKKSKVKINENQTRKISEIFPENSGLSPIKIATPSKSYQQKSDEVKRGILLHEILSFIKVENDVDAIIQDYILNGLINRSEASEIAQAIKGITNAYPQFFDAHLQVMNERELMISDNGNTEIYRPDRLVVDSDGQWQIIDFKTGAISNKHQEQVEGYKNILERIGYKVKDTHVIYVS
ncbi:MAG: UvrD-helicase domain-containing protein [Bacteroidetes bacterium]|nr:UvrD-helicase domain-containing protein [Bacteroidota bacterium]